jgi:hypothetical protein
LVRLGFANLRPSDESEPKRRLDKRFITRSQPTQDINSPPGQQWRDGCFKDYNDPNRSSHLDASPRIVRMHSRDAWILLALICFAPPGVQSLASAPNGAPPQSAQPATAKHPDSSRGFVGDDACRSCHQQKIDTYYKTAHRLTSQSPGKNSVLGTFNQAANSMRTSNPNLFFRMDSTEKGFFQTVVWGTPPHTWSRTERLDMVIGSGGKGQTYLFWNEDELFQLPVGYSTVLGHWINSPGYRGETANFDRPIIPRCLECHATFFKALEPLPSGNRYDKPILFWAFPVKDATGRRRACRSRKIATSRVFRLTHRQPGEVIERPAIRSVLTMSRRTGNSRAGSRLFLHSGTTAWKLHRSGSC